MRGESISAIDARQQDESMATVLPGDSVDDFSSDENSKTKGHPLGGKKEQKRRPKPKDGKVLFCGVCGDRALGYNFDAISCESCKAFFRRNALKVKPFVCSFEGNCVLDAHSRKFCSGCRLQKCFAIGMKKEWILDADQLQKRRQRQQTRRLHQGPSIDGMDSTSCTSTYGDSINDDPGSDGSPQGSNACHSTSDMVDQMTTFVWSSQFPNGQGNRPPAEDNHRNSYHPHSNHHHNIPNTTSTPPSSSSMSESHSPTSTTNNNFYDPSPPHSIPQHIPPHHHQQYHHQHQQQQQQHHHHQQQHSPPSSTPTPPHQPPISFVYDRDSNMPELKQHNSSHHTHSKNNASSINANPFTDVNVKNSQLDLPTSAMGNAQAAPLTSTLKRHNSSDIIEDEEMQIKPLNPYIRENLDAMCVKYKEIFDKPYNSEDAMKLLKQPKTMDQLYNMTDMFIRRLIRFTKCIAEFRSLKPDDQISLLKGGIMELFVLRSCVSFDSKGSSFKFQTQIKTETGETIVKEGGVKNSVMNAMGTSMFKNQMSVIHSIQELTGQDLTILILIFIIQLMNPNRQNVVDHKLIAEAQERHLTWLKAYLRSKYDGPKTRMLFFKLLEKLKEVQELGKASCQMLVNVEIDRLEPILIEIFDLG